MLKNHEIQETIIAEDGKAYAYAEGLANPKREVDGCDAREFIDKLIKHSQEYRKKLQSEINRIDKDILHWTRTDNQLAADGYCKKDLTIFHKVDGVVQYDNEGKPIVAKYTHHAACKNANKGQV